MRMDCQDVAILNDCFATDIYDQLAYRVKLLVFTALSRFVPELLESDQIKFFLGRL